MKKEKKKIEYRGLQCDSDEEKYFLMWAFELKEAGIINTIERSETFRLTNGLQYNYEEQLKTKTKPKVQTLLNPSEYTPDIVLGFARNNWQKWLVNLNLVRVLKWGEPRKIDSVFLTHEENPYKRVLTEDIKVYLEIKPSAYDQNNMERLFRNNQKFLFETQKIYVNLVKIPKFFEQTFCPKEYLLTATGKDRKINFKIVLIEEYLKNLEKQKL